MIKNISPILKLNDLATKYLPKELEPGHFFKGINRSFSVQIINENEAINLPIVGITKVIVNNNPNSSAAIVRILLGLNKVEQMIQNDYFFLLETYSSIDAALRSLTNEVGDLTNRKIQLAWPDGDIFKEHLNLACCELRVYVHKI